MRTYGFLFAAAIGTIATVLGLALPTPARAQAVTLSCEQGHVNSWKICEVNPDTFARYVWSATGTAMIDPYVCTENSSACTAWCNHGTQQGGITVKLYNANNQLVATRSRGLGCAGG